MASLLFGCQKHIENWPPLSLKAPRLSFLVLILIILVKKKPKQNPLRFSIKKITAHGAGKITGINDGIRIVNKKQKMSWLERACSLRGRRICITDVAIG